MEPNDLARSVALVFLLIGLGSIFVVIGVVLHLRRARHLQASTAQSAPPVSGAQSTAGRNPPPSRPIPQLAADEAEAMSAEERQILTAVNTLKGLPSELQHVLWAACVPHTFDLSLLTALRPELRSRMPDLYSSVQHVWFVEVTPDGRNLLQTPIRRVMIRHLSKPAEYEEFFQLSVLVVKYEYQAMLSNQPAPRKRGHFVADTFFRFLPGLEVEPAAAIEWLYHLAVIDQDNAARALRQLGDHWLSTAQFALVERLTTVLAEHQDDGRLGRPLRALLYYYQGHVALYQRRSPEALDVLEKARLEAVDDLLLRDDILKAVGIALQDLHAVQGGTKLGRAEAAAQPMPARRQWVMWDELQLPDPRQDLITRYQERLAWYRAMHNLAGEGQMMVQIAEEHLFRADYPAAVQWYEDAIRAYQADAATAGQFALDVALAQKAIGDVYCTLRRYEEARLHYGDALARLAAVADERVPLHRADLLKALGDMLRLSGNYEQALPQYENAREMYQKLGASSSAADTLLAEGEAFYAQGNLHEAQQHFDEALHTYPSAGSQTGRAQALLVLGDMTQQRGQHTAALQQFEQARTIYRGEKNLSGEASALRAMGDARAQLGEWAPALEAYQHALDYYHAAGARAGHAHTQLAVGDVYRQQQKFDQAEEQYKQAREEYRLLHDVRGEAQVLTAMGQVQFLQQHSTEALQLLDEAETLFRQASDRPGEAQARRFKGEEYLLEKQFDLALTEFEEAVKAQKNYGGYSEALAELWGRQGHTLALLGRQADALRAYDQAYDQAVKMHSRVEAGWHGFRALVDGQFDAADAYFTVVTRRDPHRVMWWIGLTMAKFGLAGAQTDEAACSAAVKEAARLTTDWSASANLAERAEACRWRDYVTGFHPDLRKHLGELGLKCE